MDFKSVTSNSKTPIFWVDYLVGGFNPSEKYQSVGIIIQNMWKNKTCYDYNVSQT